MSYSKYIESLPKGWKRVELGSVFDLRNGINFDASQRGKGILTVDVLNMYSGSLYVKTEKLYRVDISIDEDKFLRSGDILFVRSSVKEEGVGWPAIFQSSHEPTTYCGFIIRARQKEKAIDPRFLVYFLRQSFVRRQMISSAGKVAITNINQQRLGSLIIPLPPLNEQKRIAAILDKADALREKRRQVLAKLETLLQSVFLDMFGDPLTNPKNLPTKPIEEFGSVITGNTPPRSNSDFYGTALEWIKSDNINTPFHILTQAEEKLSEEGREVGRIVPTRSVLVTCIAGSPECIGNVALTDREVAFNQQINAITPNDDTNSYFLYTQLLLGKRLVQRASTNSMKGMVSKSSFSKVRLLAPPKNVQAKFGLWFEQFLKLYEKNSDAIVRADQLFQSLQQRAFNGELFNNEIEELKSLAEVSAHV